MTTAISLFSGAVDGMAIAAQAAGFRVTHHVEWDAWCCRVLRMNHPDSVVINEDIKNVGNLPPVDLIFGGSPCQDFSVAGARAGFAGERYLWPEMFRIVRESKPYAVVHENVRGGVSAGLLDQICDDLESAGYETKAFVYPANVFGAPHERYRMFIVGLQKRETMEHAERSRSPEYHAAPVRPSQGQRFGGFGTVVGNAGNSTIREKNILDSSQETNGDWHQEFGGSDSTETKRTSVLPLRNGDTRHGRSIHEPRVGRAAHGTAARLHRLDAVEAFPGWPAPQGVYQHAYEPARTTQTKAYDAKERIQALGNAVVWQQAYPIFKALKSLFETLGGGL